ncbi:hypothetical protein D9M71_820320 [compost metagenome]
MIHHLRPIGVIQNVVAQEFRLALSPEKRIRQVQFGFERGMGGDEFVDAFGVVGQAELFEKVGKAVDWGFHGGLLFHGK